MCAHHWKITSPNGPTSPGTCSLCGEQKDFLNYSEEFIVYNGHNRDSSYLSVTLNQKLKHEMVAKVNEGYW